jgi:hypothetical protein
MGGPSGAVHALCVAYGLGFDSVSVGQRQRLLVALAAVLATATWPSDRFLISSGRARVVALRLRNLW